jgi:hypothetical protein
MNRREVLIRGWHETGMTPVTRHNIEDGMTSNKRSSEGNMNNTPSRGQKNIKA